MKQDQPNTNDGNSLLSAEDIAFGEKVMNIRKSMKMAKKSQSKSTISIEEAVYDLEVTANYYFVEYANVAESFSDSIIIEVPSVADEVTLAAVEDAYITLREDTKQKYEAIPESEKYILGVDVEEVENTNGNKSIKATTIFGFGYNIPPADCYEPYTEGIAWAAAADDYENRITNPPVDCGISTVPDDTPGYTVTYESLAMFQENPAYPYQMDPWFINPENFPYPYKLFRRSGAYTSYTFDVDERQYYFNVIDDIINHFHQQLTWGEDRIFLPEFFNFYHNYSSGIDVKFHGIQVWFGYRHIKPDYHEYPDFTD